jgi:GTPase involved in cell partitioning and DNA repair
MELNELNLSEEQLADIQKYVQSETDKVRTKYSQDLKTVKDELEKFKPNEKSESEIALENRIKALEERETQIASKEKAMAIANKLADKGLPKELASYLNVGDDMDKIIDEVGATVNNYFLTNGNKPNNHTTNKGLTKADFKTMSYGERAKLFNENPELYKTLSN